MNTEYSRDIEVYLLEGDSVGWSSGRAVNIFSEESEGRIRLHICKMALTENHRKLLKLWDVQIEERWNSTVLLFPLTISTRPL